LNQLTDIDNV